jgi:hypothetical protein
MLSPVFTAQPAHMRTAPKEAFTPHRPGRCAPATWVLLWAVYITAVLAWLAYEQALLGSICSTRW